MFSISNTSNIDLLKFIKFYKRNTIINVLFTETAKVTLESIIFTTLAFRKSLNFQLKFAFILAVTKYDVYEASRAGIIIHRISMIHSSFTVHEPECVCVVDTLQTKASTVLMSTVQCSVAVQ